ncbi:MAG TPA: ChbG/HpnK family deacetylase, partial [Acidimicrobiales bacterium]
MTSLAERLGHAPEAKLLIINCDDLGSSHAANVGIYEALRRGIATSSTLMVPCPWAREAASRYRGEDVGVHLTLNAEYDLYRWGPITHAPSLLDGDGGFPRTPDDLWDHADLDEVRRELRAQLEGGHVGVEVADVEAPVDGPLDLGPALAADLVEVGVVPEVGGRAGEAAVAVEQRGGLGDGAPAVEVVLGVEGEVHADVLAAVAGGGVARPGAGDHEAGAGAGA